MKFKFYLGLLAAVFLFVGYFFVSHAYVFLRLTTVLGFMAVVFLLLAVVYFAGRIE
jgi:hypothetical protein